MASRSRRRERSTRGFADRVHLEALWDHSRDTQDIFPEGSVVRGAQTTVPLAHRPMQACAPPEVSLQQDQATIGSCSLHSLLRQSRRSLPQDGINRFCQWIVIGFVEIWNMAIVRKERAILKAATLDTFRHPILYELLRCHSHSILATIHDRDNVAAFTK